MKFLAGLVHVAVASQVVFDSRDPLAKGALGTPVSRKHGAAVQFRTPSAAEAACGAAGLTVDHVTFTVDTSNMGEDPSLWLQVDLCPSVNDMPNCTKSDKSARIPIDRFAKRVPFEWFPASPIVLDPLTSYWFTVLSNGENEKMLPMWMDGAKEFTSINDPDDYVLTAYTKGGSWYVNAPFGDRTVPSMQVYTN
ncbi:hypothetical protein H310_13384 [Aphanomyces invadans]|uniref:Uncharacterized protein n=1 Tax=Aphanomyces invadans TaxID=157072 RepID=A0A024TE62_9STRA|nr:hypothetical protein H310_13384 [Aphanomyces invadans]ETV92338.1 hypothetical protein H310_13384 [Aphanomyces invadans]|eukprot:XP_008879089.1 hypothetical protein H310_13384 [Aphanomyces invadans]